MNYAVSQTALPEEQSQSCSTSPLSVPTAAAAKGEGSSSRLFNARKRSAVAFGERDHNSRNAGKCSSKMTILEEMERAERSPLESLVALSRISTKEHETALQYSISRIVIVNQGRKADPVAVRNHHPCVGEDSPRDGTLSFH